MRKRHNVVGAGGGLFQRTLMDLQSVACIESAVGPEKTALGTPARGAADQVDDLDPLCNFAEYRNGFIRHRRDHQDATCRRKYPAPVKAMQKTGPLPAVGIDVGRQ